MEAAQRRTVGLQRLKSGEFRESVARDLRKQGLRFPDIASWNEAGKTKMKKIYVRQTDRSFQLPRSAWMFFIILWFVPFAAIGLVVWFRH